eukprot:356599-Chlamydomonas_euryale.AAC.2
MAQDATGRAGAHQWATQNCWRAEVAIGRSFDGGCGGCGSACQRPVTCMERRLRRLRKRMSKSVSDTAVPCMEGLAAEAALPHAAVLPDAAALNLALHAAGLTHRA